MDILFCGAYAGYYYDPALWQRELARLVPGVRVHIWPETGDKAAITMAIADQAPPGLFGSLPNLECVLYPGYGPNALVASGEIPQHVTIARLEDPGIARQMTEYVVLYVLQHHRAVRAYKNQQREALWALVETPDTIRTTVGLMGLGRLGMSFADGLRLFGFRLSAWARTPRRADGITTFAGRGELASFLAGCDYVVSSLPSTAETVDLFDARTFSLMKPGAVFMNLGRGDAVVTKDLLEALDQDRLAAAVLDVHRPSPLPSDSPLWSHPKVTVTPHSSGAQMGDVLPEVAEVILRVAAGQTPRRIIDRTRGY